MLRYVIFLLFFNKLQASPSCSVETLLPKACAINEKILSDVQSFQKEIIQKHENILQDPNFQNTVSELQKKNTYYLKIKESGQISQGNLYIFVSFSCGEKALLNLAQEAKRHGATLVLCGFKEGSLRKTAQALHKIILTTGQGVLIDPELFTLFNITAVPTFILAKPFPVQALERNQTPLHDRLQGHVGSRYVLETFAKEGDLKTEAKNLLERGSL